ncbi:MAG: hypothetical protein JO040_11945 [Gemmatimonadetes bacterium]|nr:hypothetical protein [Gemmatimonadota bacterium]
MRLHSTAGRSSPSLLALLLTLLLGIAIGYVLGQRAPGSIAGNLPKRGAPSPTGSTSPGAPSRSSGSPGVESSWHSGAKPTPELAAFRGCPPEGDGGDPALNRLKNRIDEPARPVPLPVDTLLNLPWPRDVAREDRARWSAPARGEVGRYEGVPLVVEGYFAGAKVEGPESPNCHGADTEMRDWHLWLTGGEGEDRTRSVVVETTPAVRARHPEWTLAAVRGAIRSRSRVRITGWLMLDPEHPDQVGRTRGTIWEIHPITRIEVQQNGSWVPLGQGAAPERPTRRRRA